MMISFIQYLLVSQLILLVFYACWRLFLVHYRRYNFNRYWLLGGLIVAFTHPLLRDLIASKSTFAGITLPMVTVAESSPLLPSSTFDFSNLIIAIYSIGLAWFMIKMIQGLRKIVSLKARASILESRVHLLSGLERLEAFSFFRWIFIPEETDDSSKSFLIIHEQAHSAQMHSADIVLMELFSVIHWFSPWLSYYSKAIRDNHEFIADNWVLQRNIDREHYINSLIRAHQSKLQISLVHSFSNKSSIKNRLVMMHKNQNKSSKWLLLIAIPFFSVAVLAACTKADVSQESNGNPQQVEKSAEVMPEFPGGQSAFMEFMTENIKYPESQKESGLSGKVIVSFVVGKNGEVRDAQVIKSLQDEFDQAALDVVANMPHWTPGKNGDKNVAVEMKLPVVFQLN